VFELAQWSAVKMYSQGVFNVWFVCPYCGYESWARAYGVGEGMDTGIKKSASASAAQFQANVMAEHAASRAVLGSPCPRCAQHHPDVVRWAAHADRLERRRAFDRKTARTLRVVAIAAGVGFVLCIATRALAEGALLALVAIACLVVYRVLLVSSGSTHARWVLYKKTAPGVTFLTPLVSSDQAPEPPSAGEG
jgi:hypothetical protein